METERSLYLVRRAENEDVEDRISLISRACHLFRRDFNDVIVTFEELKGACRLLSTLMRSVDGDSGDLCLLASHVENMA